MESGIAGVVELNQQIMKQRRKRPPTNTTARVELLLAARRDSAADRRAPDLDVLTSAALNRAWTTR